MTRDDAADGWRVGLRALDAEVSGDLAVVGELPRWLRGTLLRNGPGRWTARPGGRGQPARHWFDGLAQMHRFLVDDGRVHYANRYLVTPAYRHALEHGTFGYPEFATTPGTSRLSRLAGGLRAAAGGAAGTAAGDRGREPRLGSNASVDVHELGGRVVAVTETPAVVPVDPLTLATSEPVWYDDDLPGVSTPAHPQQDLVAGVHVSLTTTYGRRSAHHLYELPAGTMTRRQIAVVGTDRPSYMHSFGLTDRFVVLPEYPMVAEPLALLAGRSFLDAQRWRPGRGTRFTVVDRASGEVVVRTTGPPTFCFHQVAAVDTGDAVQLDLPVVDGATALSQFLLEELQGPDARSPAGELRRYRIPLDGGPVTWRVVSTAPLEFPRTAVEGHPGRAPRWVWGTGADGHRTTSFADRITKIDLRTGAARHWRRPGWWPGEPVVVPAPSAGREDDGVVLTVALDAAAQSSHLVVLDAADLTELATAQLPHPIPLGFHGRWLAHVSGTTPPRSA